MMSMVRFEVECPGAKTVFLAGDFNGWDGEARRLKRVRKGQDAFVAVMDLDPGTYEFKYVVDGEWRCCPASPRVGNVLGGENSIVVVTDA